MSFKQYLVTSIVLAAAALAAGCASTPESGDQTASKPDGKAPCVVPIGSNFCRRD